MIYKLLFIDDDEVICSIAKSFLERHGVFSVDTAMSAIEAKSFLAGKYYDAIISDYDMPETDGITFLKSIRSEKKNLPFVILTGKGQEKTILDALNNGADLYFEKSDTPGELFSCIHEKLIPLIRSRQADVLFEKLFNQSPIAIQLFDSEGRFLEANQAYISLFGIQDQNDILNLNLFQDPNIPHESMINLKAGNSVEYSDFFDFDLVRSLNLYNTSKTGKIFIDVRMTPLLHSYITTTLGYLVIIQDLTDQKQYEYALRISEERYRSLFFNNHSVMMIIDPKMANIVEANQAACSYYGYPRDVITKMGIWEINRLSKDELAREIKEAMMGSGHALQLKHQLSSGEIRDVEVHIGPIKIDDTDFLYSIIHDITDKKRAEEALYIANKKLNMLSSITRHDILNILTALTGYLEFAGTETSIEETRRFIEKARSATRSIRHHLNFTRDYQDLGTKEPVWYDVSSILQISSGLLDFGTVNLSFDKTNGLVILADPLLVKVIYNLMENSIRHGIKVTKIISSWTKNTDNSVTWIIEDDGIGIPENQKEDIFKREVGKNTGFGLFLAREILAITGFSIKETGRQEEGAMFEIDIPPGKYRIEP